MNPGPIKINELLVMMIEWLFFNGASSFTLNRIGHEFIDDNSRHIGYRPQFSRFIIEVVHKLISIYKRKRCYRER